MQMAAQLQLHGGNEILSMHRNRNMRMTITVSVNAPVYVNAPVHEDMNTSIINVVDGLNAGDTRQESDVASQA